MNHGSRTMQAWNGSTGTPNALFPVRISTVDLSANDGLAIGSRPTCLSSYYLGRVRLTELRWGPLALASATRWNASRSHTVCDDWYHTRLSRLAAL
jgi:hypothetical protein